MPKAKRASLPKCSGAAAVFGAVNVLCAGPRVGHGSSAAWQFTAVCDHCVEAASAFRLPANPVLMAGFAVPGRRSQMIWFASAIWLCNRGRACFGRRGKKLVFDGGANEIRTHDLCSAIAALSQLSYGPFRSHLVAPCKSCQGKPLPRLMQIFSRRRPRPAASS